MELRSHEDQIIQGGAVQSSTDMTVHASEKVFEIFTSSVYTYKIKAFVRELMTNALDAHIEAGKEDQPFLVIPPSKLESIFRVRDYGNGLTPQRMKEIYPVLFKSTKDRDNFAVGGFGIGSKSPLSYVDSFTVKSFVDGTLYIYSVYKSGSKIKLDLLTELPTTEPNGVEVAVPIREHDQYDCVSEIAMCSIPFDVKPLCDGVDLENLKSLDGYLTFTGQVHPRHTPIYARMGCVIYPIEQKVEEQYRSSLMYRLVNDKVILDLPVGSVDIQPSREQLDYNDYTVARLQQEVSKLTENFEKNFNEVLEKYQDDSLPIWPRITGSYDEIKEHYGDMSFDTYLGVAKFEWFGERLYYKQIIISITADMDRNNASQDVKVINLNEDKGRTQTIRGIFSRHNIRNIHCSKKQTPLHAFKDQHSDVLANSSIFFFCEPETVDYLELFYGEENVNFLDLKVEKSSNKRDALAENSYRTYVYDVWHECTYDGSDYSGKEIEDSVTECYYIRHKNRKPYMEYLTEGVIGTLAKLVTGDNILIKMLPKSLIPYAESNPKWVNIEELIIDKLDAELSKPFTGSISISEFIDNLYLKTKYDDISINSDFYRYSHKFNKLRKTCPQLLNMFFKGIALGEEENPVHKTVASIASQLPNIIKERYSTFFTSIHEWSDGLEKKFMDNYQEIFTEEVLDVISIHGLLSNPKSGLRILNLIKNGELYEQLI